MTIVGGYILDWATEGETLMNYPSKKHRKIFDVE